MIGDQKRIANTNTYLSAQLLDRAYHPHLHHLPIQVQAQDQDREVAIEIMEIETPEKKADRDNHKDIGHQDQVVRKVRTKKIITKKEDSTEIKDKTIKSMRRTTKITHTNKKEFKIR